jgi:magnesium transporter
MKTATKKEHAIPSRTVGRIPGELVYVGKREYQPAVFQLITYNEEKSQTYKTGDVQDLVSKIEETKVNWVDMDGLSDLASIEKLTKHFNFHPMMSEDIVNTEHLPKIEDFGKYLFCTLKMLKVNPKTQQIEQEHLSLVLGSNVLFTFQEGMEGDVFGSIRDRIFANKGRVCKLRADYLFYLLVDAVIDNYYLVLESIREKVEMIEDDIIANPSKNMMNDILALKKQLALIRKLVFPLDEELGKLIKEHPEYIHTSNLTYIHDAHDHVKHLINTFEAFREMLGGLMDLYMSNLSHTMNGVMKTLTVLSAIFIPLTFVAGIYGMNFENMPELKWQWGYFTLWAIMITLTTGMIAFFRRKKWF